MTISNRVAHRITARAITAGAITAAAMAAATFAVPIGAQTTPAQDPARRAPSEIVATAAPGDWVRIAPEDLLIMTLAPDPRGGAGRTGERRVVIQLMPAPFSQGWITNVRTLARAHWWDGLAIVRAQDNYVVQWGDPDGENPEQARPLPPGLRVMADRDYDVSIPADMLTSGLPLFYQSNQGGQSPALWQGRLVYRGLQAAEFATFVNGWPVSGSARPDNASYWPVHCYGMVGVGRNLSPDTGSGAELYTVVGHAPRHLDRNVALIGRVVEGMEHLSSLARGTAALGFYATPEERTGITAIRLASDLPLAEQPRFEFLSTDSAVFARYALARANRRDPFFNVAAGGTDICNTPVPLRRAP